MSERKRRDPRAERQRRRDGADDVPPEVTPSMRRDPRAERDARRSLTDSSARRGRSATRQDHIEAVKTVDDPAYLILVLADLPQGRLSPHDRDVLGAARQLADMGGGAVVVVAPAATPDLGAAGADRWVMSDVPANSYQPEIQSALARALVEQIGPRHILAPDTLTGAGDTARRLAAHLGLSVASNVHAIHEGNVTGRADGGRQDVVRVMPDVVLLAPEAAEPHAGPVHEARPMDAPVVELKPVLIDGGFMTVGPNTVPLQEADFIVSAGNGVTDWPAFHDVAASLNAAEGGSRVVCDTGYLPRDRQVGASGTLVEPGCYLAFGIAGAPQHLQGIERCERVVAVNTDLHADMVKRSDLAVIQDAQLVMPALAARARKAGV